MYPPATENHKKCSRDRILKILNYNSEGSIPATGTYRCYKKLVFLERSQNL